MKTSVTRYIAKRRKDPEFDVAFRAERYELALKEIVQATRASSERLREIAADALGMKRRKAKP